jgi:hypothetical protein
MSPDFDELVGGNDSTPEELAGLRHVHELLTTSAPPPPKLSRRYARPPRVRRNPARRSRGHLRAALAVVATTATAAAFAVGYGLGTSGGFQTSYSRTMHGIGSLASASASIGVGHRDPSGNWPLEMTIRGLPPLPANAWYELYLTKKGEPDVICGTFRTGTSAVTRVRLNAPDDLGEYTGWIVTARIPGRPQHILLTT